MDTILPQVCQANAEVYKPRVQRIERGDVDGEDLYAAVGRTDAGRSLIVFFIYKRTREALVISARETTHKEHRRYGKR